MSLKLSVAVLTLSEPSLTNTIAVLLSHEVCTAMIRTHKCGLDRDSELTLVALFIQIFTGISDGKNQKMSLLLLNICRSSLSLLALAHVCLGLTNNG